MSNASEPVVKFLKNKKARNIVILLGLVVIMLVCLKTCYSKIYSGKEEPGSVRTYLCPKCEYTGKMKTVNVGEIQCPACSTRVGFGWKCRKCEREFAVKPSKKQGLMTKQELLDKKKSESQCTNCNSFDTYPLVK